MINIIKEVSKDDLKDFIYNFDLNDKNLYKELNNPNKIGIFQISGGTAGELVKQVHPDSFEELVAINAMARPGTMEVSSPFYIRRKSGEPSPYPDSVNEILSDTHNVILFQEQIMMIFNKIGGFSLVETNEVRSLMKKLSKAEKDIKDVKAWERIVKKFVRNATTMGISKEDAEFIANDLSALSGYTFNRAHSAAYSYIAAITLYLSYYFRKYFYSVVLQYEADKEESFLSRINAVKRQGISILPPDINKSQLHFYPEGNDIRVGIADIKFVSENAARLIIDKRPFKDFMDFYIKTKNRLINTRVIEALISTGCFDSLYDNRKKLNQIIKMFYEQKKSTKVEEKLRAIYKKCENTVESLPGFTIHVSDLIEYEKKFFGVKLFTTQFTEERIKMFEKLRSKKLIYLYITEIKNTSLKIPVIINSIRNYKDRNDNPMAFIDIEDMDANTLSIPVFYSYWKFIKDDIKKDELYLMNVYKTNRGVSFGKKEWTDNEFVIRRMIKKIS